MLNKWGRRTKVLNVHGAIVGLEKVVPIGYE